MKNIEGMVTTGFIIPVIYIIGNIGKDEMLIVHV